ncbi:MAG: thioredoxin domain-containing protein [Elusimicrobia bacterium]|nr:thioredoxin domain-containing protein [Elusimicrobiota bacterium]
MLPYALALAVAASMPAAAAPAADIAVSSMSGVPGASAPGLRFDREALAGHLRKTYDIPDDVDVTFSTPVDAGVPAFYKMTARFSKGGHSQESELYMSEDGRHYILGDFKDLSVDPDKERLAKVDLRGSPVRGSKTAPVSIIEYTDFECPFCQRGYEIMRHQIMPAYEGKVKWIYKSLPLTSIHPWAQPAAIAAACVKEQGVDKFWKVHDDYFENQQDITPDNLDDKTAEFVKEADVDAKKFQACYEAKKTLPAVNRDAQEADALGITGTPAFLVNGHLVPGADYRTLKRLIDEALKPRREKG